MGKYTSFFWHYLPLILLISLALGAGIAAWMSIGAFLIGWLSTSLLLFIFLLLLFLAWRLACRGKTLAWIIALAFCLRLGAGLTLTWAFPRFGYDEPVTRAGYSFYDAYARDSQAWTLAQSGKPILLAFQQEFITDQYGGLLSLSAVVYRALSPDAQRPYLIIILSAGAAALGAAVFWSATRRKWGLAVAVPAAWILTLYPESIWLGSSQMREPFLIAFSALAFWGVVSWSERKKLAAVTLLASLLGLILFSSRAALPVMGVALGWLFLEQSYRVESQKRIWRTLGWVSILVGAILLSVLSWAWMQSSSQWDIQLTLANSGRMSGLLGDLPNTLKIPFVIIYGITQPVLPAAIADPAPLLWRIIGILRATGWYILVPLLAYSLIAIWKAKDPLDRRLLAWLALTGCLWIVISSTRGGGDQWDNPRYRIIFMVWLSVLAGWAIYSARLYRDPWLLRWILVEAIFLYFFTGWYLSRYYHIGTRLPFWEMIGLIFIFSVLVLAGGAAWDRWKYKLPCRRG